MITLSQEQEAAIIRESTSELVKALVTNHGRNPLVSCAQAAGILNVTTQTLRKLPITSYEVGGVSYRVADLEAYLETKKCNPKKKEAA